MGKPIPLELDPAHGIAIDGGIVADALGMELAVFRQRMDDRKITVLCERGVGAHAGLYRATFYYDRKRVRFVVDAQGRVVPDEDPPTRDA